MHVDDAGEGDGGARCDTEPKLERRRFLGLAIAGAASFTGLMSGCGEDTIEEGGGSGGSSDDSGSSDGSSGRPPAGTGDADGSTGGLATGDAQTGESTDDGDGSDSSSGGDPLDFDPESVPLDETLFPRAVLAGEMKPTSFMVAGYVANAEPQTLRVWRRRDDVLESVASVPAEPTEAGFVKLTVEGLEPGVWYGYGFFSGPSDAHTARSDLGEVRTAIADDALEPLTVALGACNGDSFDWPSMMLVADEYYDMFLHLGDMAYNDGATSLAEFRASWGEYMAAPGYRRAFSRAGLYATWDDHEIDDNSNFDRETMVPEQLQKRQNAMDAYFETLPIDAEGPNYRLWRSFRWGLTAEIIVLDCRYERRPSQGRYMSEQQMQWLQQRLLESPCHFKVIMNSVPITNMPLAFDVAASDRWEGFPDTRGELLGFINANDIDNVWFVSGDFHVNFVSRLEREGSDRASNLREIAVTSGNTNPVPAFILGMNPPQFDYGVTAARGVLVTFDPEADEVFVRFIDPQTGEDDFVATLPGN